MYQELPRSRSDFDSFYERFHNKVLSIALRLLGNQIEAEDIVQQVFLKIWARPDSFRGGNVEGWLTVLARNASLDVYRTRSRERRSDPDIEMGGARRIVSVEDEAIANVAQARLWDVVARLDPKCGDMVAAAFRRQLSHARIADETHLPLGTVKTRIRLGIAKLRTKLADELL